MKLRLYHYWRSSCSWRVRWAFALKGIECEFVAVDLLSGESESSEHLARNPFGFVPALEWLPEPGQAHPPDPFLTESLAIIEWVEEVNPTPSLLPGNPQQRAKIRQLAETINAGTQPLQNLGPQYLYSDDINKRKEWASHWIHQGLGAYETLIQSSAGVYSAGDQITMADLCLIPQCYNAKRYSVDLNTYPKIASIYEACMKTDACIASAPERYSPQ